MMRWNEVQSDAAAWLEAGRQSLEVSPLYTDHKRLEKRTGNYRLTSPESGAMIGESNNLRKRAKRLLKSEIAKTTDYLKPVIQVSYTDFGRKELEETPKQTDSHLAQVGPGRYDWEELQADSLELLTQGFQQLECVRPLEWMARRAEAAPGVYLVFKHSELLYINHSQNVLQSLNNHSNNTPTSALRRAIATYELGLSLKTAEELGKTDPSQTPYERHHLELNENFEVNHYLQDCLVVNLPVTIGRLELAEALNQHFAPKLMIKQRSIT